MHRNRAENTQRKFQRVGARVCGLIAASLLVMQAAPARADFCIQLSGDLSGDLGFFRFLGDLPNEKGTITPLTGRVAGLSPVWGSAVVIKKPGMSYLEIGATFYADSVLGQINVTFSPPGNRDGSGVGDYGTFGSTASFTAQRVACKLEP